MPHTHRINLSGKNLHTTGYINSGITRRILNPGFKEIIFIGCQIIQRNFVIP